MRNAAWKRPDQAIARVHAMNLDRRSALSLLGAAALAACARSGGSALRVGNQRGGTQAMMEASGLLAGLPFAIEWSEFPAAQHLLEALSGGAVDLGAVGDAPFLFAYEGGSPIRSVQATRYEPRNGASVILVPDRSAIRDVAGLAGRKVATGRGSSGHFMLLRALEKAQVPAKAVDIVFLPPGDAKGAFASGSVDAWSTWNPYAGAALLHGKARAIADGRDLFTGYGFMVASEASIAPKRAQIAEFLRRYAKAQSWAGANTDAFAVALGRETGLPADVSRYTADRALIAVRTDAALIEVQRGVLRTFEQAGAAKASRPLETAFDTSFDKDLPA